MELTSTKKMLAHLIVEVQCIKDLIGGEAIPSTDGVIVKNKTGSVIQKFNVVDGARIPLINEVGLCINSSGLPEVIQTADITIIDDIMSLENKESLQVGVLS